MKPTDFQTIPRLSSDKKAAFFSKEDPTGKTPIQELPASGLVEIRCQNPDCLTACRTQAASAKGLLDRIQTKGCPNCGKKTVSLFLIK